MQGRLPPQANDALCKGEQSRRRGASEHQGHEEEQEAREIHIRRRVGRVLPPARIQDAHARRRTSEGSDLLPSQPNNKKYRRSFPTVWLFLFFILSNKLQ